MKKIITIILITIMAVGSFTCVSSAASKYIKVKKSTYTSLKKENKKLQKELIKMTNLYEQAMQQAELATEEAEQNAGINEWLWNSISELGFYYKDKTWHQTDPVPESFKIGRTKYIVIKEGADNNHESNTN